MEGLGESQLNAMALGLGHSLSRYKLKFSPDKVDTMIVQAIGLLDDLDKEINTYAMRVKEWYGWHFPEVCAPVRLWGTWLRPLCSLRVLYCWELKACCTYFMAIDSGVRIHAKFTRLRCSFVACCKLCGSGV